MAGKILSKIENFELKHSAISFVMIIILTILITRILVAIKDMNFIIRGYEMHHIYYGITLLMIMSILMLFGKNHFRIHLSLVAISIGLILDEFLYVIGRMNSWQYTSTWPSAVIFSLIIVVIVLIITTTSKKK